MALIGAQLEGVVTTDLTHDATDPTRPVVTFTVLDVPVEVTENAALRRRIRTPSRQKRLRLDKLAFKDKLPGRDAVGFRGCTAIVVGNYDTVARKLVVDYPPTSEDPLDPLTEPHPFLEVGPPESLLLGPCTRNDAEFHVNGVRVQVLDEIDDELAPFRPEHPKNEFGIDVDWRKIQVGELVTVEGYPSELDPKLFIGFAVVVDSTRTAGLLSRPDEPQIGITRAQGRNRKGLFDLEVRGGVYLGRGPAVGPRQRIEIHRLDVGGVPKNLLGTESAVVGPEGFGRWIFGKNLTPTPTFSFAPVGVKAVYVNPPRLAGFDREVGDEERDVDIRDDPDRQPTGTLPP